MTSNEQKQIKPIEEIIFPEYNLGMVITIIDTYGNRVSYFANEILYVRTSTTKVWLKLRGEPEECCIADDWSFPSKQPQDIADRLLSIVGSIRANVVDGVR